jgi:hypothetical protein
MAPKVYLSFAYAAVYNVSNIQYRGITLYIYPVKQGRSSTYTYGGKEMYRKWLKMYGL